MALVDGNIVGSTARATRGQALRYLRGVEGRLLSDAELKEVVDAAYYLGADYGIAGDGALSQISHETNALRFGGDVTPDQKNVAGIGTTGGGVKGLRFPSWQVGIQAYYAHLLCWCGRLDVMGDVLRENLLLLDPRIPLVERARAEKGPATTWRSLGGRWAVPGLEYGAGLERHWQAILAQPKEQAMIPKPRMQVNPSPNRGGYGTPHRPEAIVWHITQGTSSLGWLTNPNSGASSNYLIDRDGTIHELVPPWESAWANGKVANPNTGNPLIARWLREGVNFNTRTISIEHEGKTSGGKGGSLTAAQVASSVHLTAWLMQEWRLPREDSRILGHNEIDAVDRPYCPGFSPQEWGAWLDRVYAMFAAPPAPQPPPPPAFRVRDYRQPSRGDRLLPGEGLGVGGGLVSGDGRHRLVMQDDGNLVLYGPDRPLWATGTPGRIVVAAILQEDGNLVLYGPEGPVWDSGTAGRAVAELVVQDDGNLVMYGPPPPPPPVPVEWASNTAA